MRSARARARHSPVSLPELAVASTSTVKTRPCAIETPSPEWEAAVVMAERAAEQVQEKVDAVYRSESRRIFATLIRLLGDFELAEDALHDAFSAALERLPKEGVPANPRAWLVSAGRVPATDRIPPPARFPPAPPALPEHHRIRVR